MIWTIFLIAAALTALYLLLPFIKADKGAGSEDGLTQAKNQRALLDADETSGRISAEAAAKSRTALDRRILSLLDQDKSAPAIEYLRLAAFAIIPAALLLGSAWVYLKVGSPNYERVMMADLRQAEMDQAPGSLEALVVTLRNRLEEDSNPPADGYVMLARSYMTLGRFEDGLLAYDQALEISDSDPEIVQEKDRALTYIRQVQSAPSLDPAMRAEIEAMSEAEQAEMIKGMVESLAVRLELEPRDIEGWVRLLRARLVMGDVQQAAADLETARAVFKDDAAAQRRLVPFEIEIRKVSSAAE